MRTQLNNRVLRTYVDAIIAPRVVALKQSILSSTGLMASMVNQSNNNSNVCTEQAQIATTQANNAANSATSATNTWNTMRAWITSFNKRWLGVQPSDPTKDNNGDPLTDGVEYYNSTTNHVRVWKAADNTWHDQDEQTENEMNSATVSASNAAASAANALATQKAVSDLGTYMNTYWLGNLAQAPTQDRNGNPITPGAWFFNTLQNTTQMWNGSVWTPLATNSDLLALKQTVSSDYVRTDGSNPMTGPLTIGLGNRFNLDINTTEGLRVTGSTSAANNAAGTWIASPSIQTEITDTTATAPCWSGMRTSYATNSGLSYLDLYHSNSNQGGCFLGLFSDGHVQSSGDIWAGGGQNYYFRGKALYSANADVAELYSSTEILEAGTVVKIDRESKASEITVAHSGDEVFGIISSSPGVLLNQSIEEREGMYPVALAGRVPAKITGPVFKGDALIVTQDGKLRSRPKGFLGFISKYFYRQETIAFALEDAHDDIPVVEVAIK